MLYAPRLQRANFGFCILEQIEFDPLVVYLKLESTKYLWANVTADVALTY